MDVIPLELTRVSGELTVIVQGLQSIHTVQKGCTEAHSRVCQFVFTFSGLQ